jgi:serine protease
MIRIWHLVAASLCVVLAACGGSGGGGGGAAPVTPTAPGNTAPVADAGLPVTVAAGAVVTLNGSASSDVNGDALTFSWALSSKPAGSAAVLNAPTTVRPVFTADVAGTYVATLTVNDGRANSAPATVQVTVTSSNKAPVANAGADQSGVTGTLVQLDGRASSDPDRDPLTYTWALVKPAGSTAALNSTSSATPSFTPDIVGVYGVGLVVSDGKLNSAAVSVLITVKAPAVGPFSVAGTIFAASVSTVDSDTNDTNQQGRASNNSLATAQISGNPGLVVGYVNRPNTGPKGANYAAGDTRDIYRADLLAGQVVELNFGDSSVDDLDLYIYDSAGTLVGQSTGSSRSECVLVRRTGTFSIEVYAFKGASTYELSWGAPRPSSTCANVTPASASLQSFVPGDIIGRALSSAAGANTVRAQSWMQSAGLTLRSSNPTGEGPQLFSLPAAREPRALALRSLQLGDRVRAASAGSAVTVALHEAPADVPEATRLAFDTVIATKLMRESGQFAYADLNLVVEQTQVAYGAWPPNDTDLSRQPHLQLIKLPEAFAALNGLSPKPSYTPIVAVVDTGVVADHPELQRMLVPGYDFVANPSNSGDSDGIDSNPNDASQPGQNTSFHGTHVAGTIAAETFNGTGMVGVAPMARIMPVRVLGVSGSGAMYDIMQGVRFAAGLSNDSGTLPARRADVINLSLGAAGACPAAVADVLAGARAQGTMVVVAAGNDGRATVSMPGNCPGVIAVSAVAYDGSLAAYSNSGPEITVAAPGGDSSKSSPAGRDEIWSLGASFVADAAGVQTRKPGYRALQGTSMATPHVAGVLALMRAAKPSITPAAVDALFASGALTDDLGPAGRDNQFGYGRINALKAVLASGATPPPAALPSLQVSPSSLDFGSTLTELSFTVTRVNGSTDTPTLFRRNVLNQLAVRVFLPAVANPPNGPFSFTVRIDRSLLAPGENVVRIDVITPTGASYPLDVVTAPRPVLAVSQRGLGPLYVVAIDADSSGGTTLAGSTAQSSTPTYSYTVSGIKAPRVVIAVGNDLDNDGFICGPAEPCGAFPILGSPTVLTLSANRTGVNFNVLSGSTNGASLATDATTPRGFRRPP